MIYRNEFMSHLIIIIIIECIPVCRRKEKNASPIFRGGGGGVVNVLIKKSDLRGWKTIANEIQLANYLTEICPAFIYIYKKKIMSPIIPCQTI